MIVTKHDSAIDDGPPEEFAAQLGSFFSGVRLANLDQACLVTVS